jgi:hypothetical protein
MAKRPPTPSRSKGGRLYFLQQLGNLIVSTFRQAGMGAIAAWPESFFTHTAVVTKALIPRFRSKQFVVVRLRFDQDIVFSL